MLEGIGDEKIRANSSSLDHPLVILADQAIEIVAIEKKVMVGRIMRSAYWLNHDPTGMLEAVTVRRRSNGVTAHQRTNVTAFQCGRRNTERVALHRHRKRLGPRPELHRLTPFSMTVF